MRDGTPNEMLVEQCNELLRRIGGLGKAQDSDWLSLDVGMGQFKALVVLKEQGRQTVGGLARALSISEPSASLLIDRLVLRGFVGRETDTEDRRRTLVALTGDGDELMTRLRRSREGLFVGWLNRLDEDDLRALLQGLAALVGVAESGE